MSGIVVQWAGHFKGGASDKVWAAAVTSDGLYLATWGRRGSNLQSGNKPFATVDAARKEFDKKRKEKLNEGYAPIAFDDPYYSVKSFGAVAANVVPTRPSAPVKAVVYLTSHVTAIEPDDLDGFLSAPLYCLQEKINGERTVVAFDGAKLTAYNRNGQLVAAVPDAAQPLTLLGVPFVVDGERLAGKAQAGEYVVFDLLEYAGRDLRGEAYSTRIALLEKAMREHKLTPGGTAVKPTTFPDGYPQGLTLLTGETAPDLRRAVLAQVKARGGEGIIFRKLDAPYEIGATRHLLKFKLLADIDVLVIAVKPGKATGSIVMGLVRPSDGMVIEVGGCRSGLVDADLENLAGKLRSGEYPVLKVEYLPARTVGIRLVEPRTSIRELRTDKAAVDCTTDQLGREKAALVEAEPGLFSLGRQKRSVAEPEAAGELAVTLGGVQRERTERRV